MIVVAALAAAGLVGAGVATGAPLAQKPPARVSGTGTIVFINVEGGFYGLVSDNGTNYYPTNLEDQFCKSGMRVEFNGTVSKNQSNIVMWGTVIDLDSIRSLEAPKSDPSMAIVTIAIPAVFLGLLVGRVVWLKRKSRPPVQ